MFSANSHRHDENVVLTGRRSDSVSKPHPSIGLVEDVTLLPRPLGITLEERGTRGRPIVRPDREPELRVRVSVSGDQVEPRTRLDENLARRDGISKRPQSTIGSPGAEIRRFRDESTAGSRSTVGTDLRSTPRRREAHPRPHREVHRVRRSRGPGGAQW